MNKYESIIIVNPEVNEEGLKALEEKFTGLINENGKVESVESMGKRKLAYPIKNSTKQLTYYLILKQNQLQLQNLKEFIE